MRLYSKTEDKFRAGNVGDGRQTSANRDSTGTRRAPGDSAPSGKPFASCLIESVGKGTTDISVPRATLLGPLNNVSSYHLVMQ